MDCLYQADQVARCLGLFEWAPKRIRIQISPENRDIDIDDLLAELFGSGLLMCYSSDGRELGAVLNFQKHQKFKCSTKRTIPEPFPGYCGAEEVVIQDTSVPGGYRPILNVNAGTPQDPQGSTCESRETHVDPGGHKEIPSGREGKGREGKGLLPP